MIRSMSPSDLAAVEEVFWQTSAKTEFLDLEAKSRFLHRYLGIYLQSEDARNFVYETKGQILGYIICFPDTNRQTTLREIAPLLARFEDLYSKYPAHLHINMSPKSQGLGLGSQLIQALESELRLIGVTGLHLLTAPDGRNRSFYEKNGFLFHVVRKDVLFMGKLL